MVGLRLIAAGTALASIALLGGCNGQPEDSGSTADASATSSTAPPPALPAWAPPMIGHQLSEFAKGSTTCKGKIDTVTTKHTGAKKGSEVQGWAWDEAGAKPFDKVVFTDPAGKITGAAMVGTSRPDVTQAMPEVKTAGVGWSGVIYSLSGPFRAIGLSANGASCQFDASAL